MASSFHSKRNFFFLSKLPRSFSFLFFFVGSTHTAVIHLFLLRNFHFPEIAIISKRSFFLKKKKLFKDDGYIMKTIFFFLLTSSYVTSATSTHTCPVPFWKKKKTETTTEKCVSCKWGKSVIFFFLLKFSSGKVRERCMQF